MRRVRDAVNLPDWQGRPPAAFAARCEVSQRGVLPVNCASGKTTLPLVDDAGFLTLYFVSAAGEFVQPRTQPLNC